MRGCRVTFVMLVLAGSGCAPGQQGVKKDEERVQGDRAQTGGADTMDSARIEAELEKFIAGHVARVSALERENNKALWKATTTGDKDAYREMSRTELAIRKVYADPESFAFLQRVRKSGKVDDPLLARQLEILYLDFQENQVAPDLLERMVNLSTEIQEAFNQYRGEVGGKKVTDNDIYDMLKSVRDSKLRREAWVAYKKRGELVRDRVLALVRLRNQAARKLGYPDFYQMRLRLIEQDPAEIQRIFDTLASQTEQPFRRLMEHINAKLSARYGIQPDELRPWHYEDPFFQEAPAVGKVDLDAWFAGHDPKDVVTAFFRGVGLDPADILERSDLYEKEGKMPHAYCIDMDREGDVRILANLRPSEKWTSTLMHEMGHAVYDKFIDPGLPWLLRQPSHAFTTEAVAELFGRFTRDPLWLKSNLELAADKVDPVADEIRGGLRMSMLIMARWTMVMVAFERALYADPDQDLNKLWWDLKKRYQLLTPPEGRDAADWASKIHIAAWPAYYHNYMLGELMASQLLHHLATGVMGKKSIAEVDFTGKQELGAYLKEKIFEPGKLLRWDALLQKATGETLNPKHFADQFVD